MLSNRVETLSRQLGLGFVCFGAAVLLLAASMRFTWGDTAGGTLAFLISVWFLMFGGLFHVTRETWMAYMAAAGWYVLLFPFVIAFGLNPILAVGLIAVSVVPFRSARDLAAYRTELKRLIGAQVA